MVPQVVRLKEAGTCSCGTVVPAGERAGSTRQPGLVVCLPCLAAISGNPDGSATDELPTDASSTPEPLEPLVPQSPDEATEPAHHSSAGDTPDRAHAAEALDELAEIPAPVAVVIPADWGPSSPTSLPSWQREAGVTVTLPPAAPISTVAFAPAAPKVAVQISATALAEATAATEPNVEGASEPSVEGASEPNVEGASEPTTEVAPAPTPAPTPATAPQPAPEPAPATISQPAPELGPDPAPEATGPAAATTPHTDRRCDPVAITAPPALEAPPAVVEAAVTEAAAFAVPSHRRRTILPPGLLALRPSRGREPGSTGQSDPVMRAFLDSASEDGVLALHDRRMPGRRGRIAHLAFGAGGVYVIDVVRAKNASVEVRVVDELDHDTHELVVDGRPMNATVSATRGRVEIVRALLDEVELTTVPVIGVMCFVDAFVPDDGPLAVAGVHVTGRSGLPALVGAEGALEADHRETLRDYLTERLPAA